MHSILSNILIFFAVCFFCGPAQNYAQFDRFSDVHMMEEADKLSELTTGDAAKPFVYEVHFENNTVCLRVEMSGQFSIQYTDTKNRTKVAKVPLIKAQNVTGACASPKSDWALLEVDFPTEEILQTMTMGFSRKSGKVSLENFTLSYLPKNGSVFVNPSDTEYQDLAGTPKMPLSADSSYFECDSPLTLKFSEANSSLQLENLKLQAFGLKNGSYSPSGQHCAGDMTTSAPMTTVPTTPAPVTPLLNFTVQEGDNVCLLMSVMMDLSVLYTANLTEGGKKVMKNVTKTLPVPLGTTASGHCGNDTEDLQLTFYKNWKLTFGLMKDNSAKTFSLSNMTLDFTVQPGLLPNASHPGKEMTVHAAFDKSRYETPSSNYYVCKTARDVQMTAWVKLHISNIKLQAFRNTNATDFLGSAKECVDDMPTDNIVPIVVGAALAGLVVIVIIAYIIGRRRTTAGTGYQSV